MTDHAKWLVDTINNNGFQLVAEVGVQAGETSRSILEFCPGVHLFMIDSWGIDTSTAGFEDYCDFDHTQNQDVAMRVASLFPSRATVVNCISTEASQLYVDFFFDMVFIDAGHTKTAVAQDIYHWENKVHDDGIFCGHDYANPNFPGVRKAVDSRFGKHVCHKKGTGRVWWVSMRGWRNV